MKKRVSLTIGIPAHNEVNNLPFILQSILAQKQTSYRIERIIVICDGCTDDTVKIARAISKKYSIITVYDDKKRLGKAERLNQIYSKSKSDYLLTLDADILLERTNEIEIMVVEMQKRKGTKAVGARIIPTNPKTFMEHLSFVSWSSFEEAFLIYKNGNNFYSLVGCATLLKRDLYKTLRYPHGIISDQNYLYASVTSLDKNAYCLARETRIRFRTVNNFYDWRLLGVRSVFEDKLNVASFFGNQILNEYRIPKLLFAIALMHWLIKQPIYTIGSIIMNIYIRVFPLSEKMSHDGIWEVTKSSKLLISSI